MSIRSGASAPLARAGAGLLLALIALAQAEVNAQNQVDPGQLGRLFATPAERQALDAKRGVGGDANMAAPVAEPAPAGASEQSNLPQAPASVRLNGVVRASNGHTTVWLDGTPQEQPASTVRNNQQVQLRLSSGRRILMKPGQNFDPTQGTVRDEEPAPPAPAAPVL